MKYNLTWLLFAVLVLVNSCNVTDSKIEIIEVNSDLEEIISINGKLVFKTNDPNSFIKNADFVSSEFSFSGKNSVKLDSNHVYGLGYKMESMEEGDFIRATVWQKKGGKDGTLVASIKGKDYTHKFRTFYDKNSNGVNGWIQHSISFIVTKNVKQIDFFVFSGKKKTYFDNLKITKYPTAPKNTLEKKLSLYIPKKSKKKLDKYISNALKSEIIPKSDKKYVKAYLINNDDTVSIKMKIKGDWTDHIKSGKTSYRIKMDGNNAFHGMKTFSIQHPKTRNYIHEWILHKMADIEDVLSTTYDFASVDINGTDYGVYALEEHFDKQLLESRDRREGPIVKFDESGVWALNYEARKKGVKKGNFPYFDASMVNMFKSGRTLSNPNLKQQFDEANTLLNLFKNGHLNIEDIFDIDLLAKFYVLMEIGSNNHGLAWHNRRFYYNPIVQKIEHIIYDAIPHAVKETYRSNIKGNLIEEEGVRELSFDNAILLNAKFKSKYMFYLDKMTKTEYIDSVFNLLDDDLNNNLKAITGEEPHYKFDINEYYRNAKALRNEMTELDSVWESKIQLFNKVDDWIRTEKYFIRKDSFFVAEISINAYLKTIDSVNYQLLLENYHLNDVDILGYYSVIDKKEFIPFNNNKGHKMKPFLGRADSLVINLNSKPKNILITVNNIPTQKIKVEVMDWEKAKKQTSRMKLEHNFNNSSNIFDIKDNEIIIKNNVVIDRLIAIPSIYSVKILPGVVVEFINGGGLIISNNFIAIGTMDKPIKFICKDSSSQGLTILKGEEAILKYVECDGLSNLNYEKWQLTGAISIYETKVEISNVEIRNNISEDALNIIRSHFNINELTIKSTYSDGFDADFCTGSLLNSSFINTGNDCIDFSGSHVNIENITIINSGDKGISGGERSNLSLTNININGAITGIASKDDTKIKGDSIAINQVEVGYAAFQKKGEYGPAFINLSNVKTTNYNQLVLVELNSALDLNNKLYQGEKKLDIDKLYERFEKK